jgi:purine-nucleoside phosphorylase
MPVTLEEIDRIAGVVHSKSKSQPRIGLILGTGLGGVAEAVQQPTIIPYSELPEWPVSTVVGHIGRLVIGELDGW